LQEEKNDDNAYLSSLYISMQFDGSRGGGGGGGEGGRSGDAPRGGDRKERS
jgi:hypothetical protein